MSEMCMINFQIKQLEKKKAKYNSTNEIHSKMIEIIDKKINDLRNYIMN